MNEFKVEKLTTGINELDKSLKGGIPKKHLILITGTAGTMKSSLAFQFAYANALEGKKAIYITLEQDAASIVTQIKLMNFDFSKIKVESNNKKINDLLSSGSKNAKGMLNFLDIGNIRKTKEPAGKFFSWWNHIKTELAKCIKTNVPDIIVLDSLTALYHMEDFKDTRTQLIHVFEFLKTLGATTFIINEMLPGDEKYSEYGVESYLVDGVLLVSMKRREFSVKREISIVKMRYVDHDTDVYVFRFNKSKAEFVMSRKLEKE